MLINDIGARLAPGLGGTRGEFGANAGFISFFLLNIVQGKKWF
jgi:hypothetical protein